MSLVGHEFDPLADEKFDFWTEIFSKAGMLDDLIAQYLSIPKRIKSNNVAEADLRQSQDYILNLLMHCTRPRWRNLLSDEVVNQLQSVLNEIALEFKKRKKVETARRNRALNRIRKIRSEAGHKKATVIDPDDRRALRAAFRRKMKNATSPNAAAKAMITHINVGHGGDYGLKNDYRNTLSPDALKRIVGVKK